MTKLQVAAILLLTPSALAILYMICKYLFSLRKLKQEQEDEEYNIRHMDSEQLIKWFNERKIK